MERHAALPVFQLHYATIVTSFEKIILFPDSKASDEVPAQSHLSTIYIMYCKLSTKTWRVQMKVPLLLKKKKKKKKYSPG